MKGETRMSAHPDSVRHDHRHHGRNANKKALILSLLIITVFLVVEVIGAIWTNSLALLSDASHMLSDSSALFLSLIAMYFASKKPSPAKTYGFYRFEILAALVNGVTLVLISLFIFWEAYQRLFAPPVVAGLTMMGIACVGLLANVAAAAVLMRGDYQNNLNLRSAFLHMLGDMLGSVGAIVAGFAMWQFEWYLADPLISVAVGVLILLSAWRVMKDSVNVLMEGTPSGIDVEQVSLALTSIPGGKSVHDLHIWTVTSGFHSLTCHLHVEDDVPSYPVLHEALHLLESRFQITHATIQVENSSIRHREPICTAGIPEHDGGRHVHHHHGRHSHPH